MKAKAYTQLRSACTHAVEEGILTKNPCPKSSSPKRHKREKNALEKDALQEMWKRLDAIYDMKPVMVDMARLALHTGMRIGELCALSFDDITPTQIHVRRAIARNGGALRLKNYTKNGERRDIDLNDGIREIIERRRAIMSEHNKNLSGTYVFAQPTTPKQYPSPAYIGKQWNMFATMSGIKGVADEVPHFHDLRHTFASQALAAGIDVTTVAAILGHANIKTTLTYYARWMPSTRASSMQKIGQIMKADSE